MRWQDATQKFDEAVGARYGLGPSERLCLSFLARGPQTASAVAREIRLTPAAVTTLSVRLAARHYVRREADPADRRKVMVVAAEATMTLMAEIYGPIAAKGATMLAGYTEPELQTIARMLREVIDLQERETEALLDKS